MRAPLGLFGGFRGEAGRVDLKLGGLLPLVTIARVLGIKCDSPSHATPARLMDAADGERLPRGDALRLIEAHTMLMTLILRQQLRDIEAGIAPSSRIDTRLLSRSQKHALKDELRWLEDVLLTLRAAVAG